MRKISRIEIFGMFACVLWSSGVGYAKGNSKTASIEVVSTPTNVAIWAKNVDIMIRLEEKNRYTSLHRWQSLFESAYAVREDGDEDEPDTSSPPVVNHKGESCILAGYIGERNAHGSCKFTEKQSAIKDAYDKDGTVTCNREVFGPDVTFKAVKGQPDWTRQCANKLLEKAGAKSKFSELSQHPEDQTLVSNYLRKIGADTWFVKSTSELCTVARNSGNRKDFEDCHEIEEMVRGVVDYEKHKIANRCVRDDPKNKDAKDLAANCGAELFNYHDSKQRPCEGGLNAVISEISNPGKGKSCYPADFVMNTTKVLSQWLDDSFNKDSDPKFAAKTINLGRCDLYVSVEHGKVSYVASRVNELGNDYEGFRAAHAKTIQINHKGVAVDVKPIDLSSGETAVADRDQNFLELVVNHESTKRAAMWEILKGITPDCMEAVGVR